jgi:hypothetical protein
MWGPMEATPPFSVISLRRLGGAPDLRVPCVFGQRLDGYHPFEGPSSSFTLRWRRAWGRILRPTSESESLLQNVRRRSPPPKWSSRSRHCSNSSRRVLSGASTFKFALPLKRGPGIPQRCTCWAGGTSATSTVYTSHSTGVPRKAAMAGCMCKVTRSLRRVSHKATG